MLKNTITRLLCILWITHCIHLRIICLRQCGSDTKHILHHHFTDNCLQYQLARGCLARNTFMSVSFFSSGTRRTCHMTTNVVKTKLKCFSKKSNPNLLVCVCQPNTSNNVILSNIETTLFLLLKRSYVHQQCLRRSGITITVVVFS